MRDINEIHMKFHKENIKELMQYLIHVIYNSLDERSVPDILKIGTVVYFRKVRNTKNANEFLFQ